MLLILVVIISGLKLYYLSFSKKLLTEYEANKDVSIDNNLCDLQSTTYSNVYLSMHRRRPNEGSKYLHVKNKDTV